MTMDYTIDRCYEVYKLECLEENLNFVTFDKFRTVFTQHFNIEFRSSKSNTCSICIHIAIKEAKSNNNREELSRVEIQQELHRKKATAG